MTYVGLNVLEVICVQIIEREVMFNQCTLLSDLLDTDWQQSNMTQQHARAIVVQPLIATIRQNAD